MKKHQLTGHFQGLYLKDEDFSAKYKGMNQDQTVKDKEFTSDLQKSFRTRTNITAESFLGRPCLFVQTGVTVLTLTCYAVCTQVSRM